jgi:hypothetical protein
MNTHDLAKMLLATPARPIDEAFGSAGGLRPSEAVKVSDGHRVFLSVYPPKGAAPVESTPKVAPVEAAPVAPKVRVKRTKAPEAPVPAAPVKAPAESPDRVAALEAKVNALLKALGA